MKSSFKYLVMVMGLFFSSVISAQSITGGADILCSGGSSSYSYSAAVGGSLPSGYQWNVSTNLSLPINPATANPVTATATGSGSAWIRVADAGGIQKALKYIWIGPPASFSISGESYISPNSGTSFYTNNPGGATSFEWDIKPAPNSFISYGSYASAHFTVEGTYKVSVRAKNACGTGSWVDHYITVGSRAPSPAYPNPANDVLNVEVGATVSALARGASINYDVRLYNGVGTMVGQAGNRGGGTVQIDVSNLPNGIYYLHVIDGVNSTPEVQRIIVKH